MMRLHIETILVNILKTNSKEADMEGFDNGSMNAVSHAIHYFICNFVEFVGKIVRYEKLRKFS